MVADAAPTEMSAAPARAPAGLRTRAWLARRAEAVAIPVAAAVAGFVLFGIFLGLMGKSPVQLVEIVWRGGFGSAFALGNSLQRAAPLGDVAEAVDPVVAAPVGQDQGPGIGDPDKAGPVAARAAVQALGPDRRQGHEGRGLDQGPVVVGDVVGHLDGRGRGRDRIVASGRRLCRGRCDRGPRHQGGFVGR